MGLMKEEAEIEAGDPGDMGPSNTCATLISCVVTTLVVWVTTRTLPSSLKGLGPPPPSGPADDARDAEESERRKEVVVWCVSTGGWAN
jgi:hypothetical protein